MKYDLHTHSNNSDGAFPPAEVVRRAAERGLDGIALTDHDSTAGLAEARVAGASLGVEVLTGCEVSSRLPAVGVHMLAYFIDDAHPRWSEEMSYIRDDRLARAVGMIEKLQELGVPVTIEQVRAIAKGESIGRPHVAQALVDAGVVKTTPDAFTPEWIGDGGRAYVSKKVLGPVETVKLIVEAGGVAGIAHAIWIEREGGNPEALIEECVAAGMRALEIDHPDHDLDTRIRFRKVAERFGLIGTASSDYHGNAHGGTLGENSCGEDVIAALRAAVPSA
jgi:3',5'-nucleoside bisphosphate phosphatase